MTIPRGLYETLLTESLAASLREVDETSYDTTRDVLDPADSYLLFVRHLRDVLQRVLTSYPVEDRLARQAEISNRVVELLGQDASGSTSAGDRRS